LSSRIIYFKVEISQNNKRSLPFYIIYIYKTQKIGALKISRSCVVAPVMLGTGRPCSHSK
jgi:hypothetical protein